MAWVLPDCGQAFLEGTIQVRADNSRRSARTNVDSLGAGLLGRVLLADAASPGSPGSPGSPQQPRSLTGDSALVVACHDTPPPVRD